MIKSRGARVNMKYLERRESDRKVLQSIGIPVSYIFLDSIYVKKIQDVNIVDELMKMTKRRGRML